MRSSDRQRISFALGQSYGSIRRGIRPSGVPKLGSPTPNRRSFPAKRPRRVRRVSWRDTEIAAHDHRHAVTVMPLVRVTFCVRPQIGFARVPIPQQIISRDDRICRTGKADEQESNNGGAHCLAPPGSRCNQALMSLSRRACSGAGLASRRLIL